MLKTLDRYVFRIFGVAVGSTIVFMVGLYLIVHFLTHIRYIAKARESFGAVGQNLAQGFFRYYVLHLPEIMVLLGPYALLFGAMYTLHHLNRNNELVPMYVVGVSRLRVTAPLFVATAVAALGLAAVKEQYIPRHLEEMDLVARRLRGSENPIDDRMGLIRDSFDNVVIFRTWNRETKELRDVHLQTKQGSTNLNFDLLTWHEGKPRGQFRGVCTNPDDHPSRSPATTRFEAISDLQLLDLLPERRRIRRMSFNELRLQHDRRQDDHRIATEMHAHVAYPFTCFVLLLIGLPFVMRGSRRNVFAGLSACLILSLAYFATTQIFVRLGGQGDIISPLLGAWLPIAVFTSIGIIVFESSDR
ncbi:MAG: LptF/LptG family permease [Planctomycetota bacterium]